MADRTYSFWSRHADKIGSAGSFIVGLCCLGVPAMLSIVSAIGLGFLLTDAILVPMLAVFLAVTLYGLWNGFRRHGSRVPLITGSVGAAGVLAFLWFSSLLAAVSLAALVTATLLNVWFARQRHARAAAHDQHLKL